MQAQLTDGNEGAPNNDVLQRRDQLEGRYQPVPHQVKANKHLKGRTRIKATGRLAKQATCIRGVRSYQYGAKEELGGVLQQRHGKSKHHQAAYDNHYSIDFAGYALATRKTDGSCTDRFYERDATGQTMGQTMGTCIGTYRSAGQQGLAKDVRARLPAGEA